MTRSTKGLLYENMHEGASPDEGPLFLPGSAACRESLRHGQTKADLLGEFADVHPITIRNAGLVLREATKRLDAAKLMHRNAQAAVEETNRAYNAALDDHRKAEYLLKISALQPNGGEA